MNDKKFKIFVMVSMIALLFERAIFYLFAYNKIFTWMDYIIERVLEISR